MKSLYLACVAAAATLPSLAFAESPERMTLDVGVGPYEPAFSGDQFRTIYGNERGPIVTADSTFHFYHIPHFGPLGVTAGFGWARYSASACIDTGCTQRSTEDLHYDLFPMAASLHLRIDTLWDEWHIPFFVSGSIGAEYVRYRETKGGDTEARGGRFGLRWRAQLAFLLDVMEPRAARALDETNGINHSYLFFELRGDTATSSFPVADRLTYVGGLGLVF